MFLTLSTVYAPAQGFAGFPEYLLSLPEAGRQARVDSFLGANPVSPLTTGDTICHFIYAGQAQSVLLAGDATQWAPGPALTKVDGTNFWHLTLSYEADARLDYKFVVNGSNWILDPRNPYTCAGGFGPNSELRMPAYVPPAEIVYMPGISHGQLWDTLFYSTNLNNTRKIWVYTPAGLNPAVPCPVIYVHDGDGYLYLAQIRNTLDYLIHQQVLQPLIAVFIPPVDRTDEYAGNKQAAFTRFVTEEVIPWVDRKYPTLAQPWGRGNLGASNGGNISLWLTVSRPDVFGRVAAMSSNVEPNITQAVQAGVTPAVKYYLDLGTYDIPILISRVRQFKSLLTDNGSALKYQEFNEGHSWGNWKAHVDDALIWLFGNAQGTGRVAPPGLQFRYGSQNRCFEVGVPCGFGPPYRVTLDNLSGKAIHAMDYPQVTTKLGFVHPPVQTGVYILCMHSGGKRSCRKVFIP